MIEQFHAPGTVREALRLKEKLKGRTVFLAGGTYVNSSECSLRPEHAISLARLGLDRVVKTAREVSIGARCTLQQLAEDRGVPAPLQAAALQVRSRNIRNMATLGGHVAGNLPFSDLIPTLVALDAMVVLAGAGATKTAAKPRAARAGSGSRPAAGGSTRLPVEEFVRSTPAGLITHVILPRPGRNRVAACRNLRASANARSTLSAAVSLTVERTGIAGPVIALGGLGRHAIRLTAVEEALNGKPLPSLDELQALVGPLLPAGAGRRGGAARARRPGGVRTPAGNASAGDPACREYQAAALIALTLHDALRQKGGRS